jgi:hypothetical protein
MSTLLNFNSDSEDEYASETCEPLCTVDTSINEICERLMDLSLSLTTRINHIISLQERDPLQLYEAINQFCISFTENKSFSLEETLSALVDVTCLPFPLRLKCAMTIDKSDKILDCIESVLHSISDHNHTLCFEAICSCLEDCPTRCKSSLLTIFTNKKLEESYRYRLLCNLMDIKIEPLETLKGECAKALFLECKIAKYIVFTGQLCVKYNQLSLSDCESLLLSMDETSDKKSSDIAAAEICDFLLHCSIAAPIHEKIKARLMKIEGVDVVQMFKSSQSVHQVGADIESFIQECIDVDSTPFATVYQMCKESQYWNDQIANSLHRFTLDQGLYSSFACSLLTICCKCFTKIQSHAQKDLLFQRFCEELTDMSDTCSSGHLIRLINVFSGIEGGITINIKDEIKSVMQHRVTQLIQKQTPEVQEQIIEELEKKDQEIIMKFLYKEMAILHDIMREEYRDCNLTDNQFTEYFRNAILHYTCILPQI